MATPRRHAKLIKKWADDDSMIVQFKFGHEEGKWADDPFPTWEDCYDFREKPETIRYRVALMKLQDGDIFTTTADDDSDEVYKTQGAGFVKWITDWIEVEI